VVPSPGMLVEGQPSLKRNSGFNNPETLAKAIKNSQLVRAKHLTPGLEIPFDEEDYEKLALGNAEDFIPTKRMMAILKIALSLEVGNSIRGWFSRAGMNRNTWYEWVKIPGFHEWWKKAIVKGFRSYEAEWLSIGMRKMRKDFRYWNTMGEVFFKYAKQLEVKENKSEEEELLIAELREFVTGINREKKQKVIDVSKSDEDITDAEVEFLNKKLEGENNDNS